MESRIYPTEENIFQSYWRNLVSQNRKIFFVGLIIRTIKDR
jgi:hypothetical protein